MAARRQSAVEVAGGYVLDAIRTERARNDSEMAVVRLRAQLEQAEDHKKFAYESCREAAQRLNSYMRAAIDAE